MTRKSPVCVKLGRYEGEAPTTNGCQDLLPCFVFNPPPRRIDSPAGVILDGELKLRPALDRCSAAES